MFTVRIRLDYQPELLFSLQCHICFYQSDFTHLPKLFIYPTDDRSTYFFTWIKKNILYIFNLKVVNDGLNQFGFGLFSCLEFKNFTRNQFIEIFLFVYFHILMDCYRIWIWDLYGYKLFWVSIDLRKKNFIDLIFQSSFGLLEGANLDGSVWDWVIKLTNNLIFLAKKLLKTVFYLV